MSKTIIFEEHRPHRTQNITVSRAASPPRPPPGTASRAPNALSQDCTEGRHHVIPY